MAAALWRTGTTADWTALRARLDSTQGGKPELAPLERWAWGELRPAVRSRSSPHVTKDELVKLVRWKLTRGKWRPLLHYAENQRPDAVVEASTAAFTHLPRGGGGGGAAASDAAVSAALKALTALPGVGPATAAMLLLLVDDSCPAMSDEALASVQGGGGKLQYTPKAYMALRAALVAKARELAGATGDASWTAVDTERCLFAADLEARGGSGGDGGDRAKKGNAAAEPGSKRPAAGKAAKAKHPAGSSGKAAGGGDSGAGQAEVGASEGARPKRRKAE